MIDLLLYYMNGKRDSIQTKKKNKIKIRRGKLSLLPEQLTAAFSHPCFFFGLFSWILCLNKLHRFGSVVASQELERQVVPPTARLDELCFELDAGVISQQNRADVRIEQELPQYHVFAGVLYTALKMGSL